MDFDSLTNFITNTSFPMAITAYLLFRLEKQLSSLSFEMNRLNAIISAKLGAAVNINENMEN